MYTQKLWLSVDEGISALAHLNCSISLPVMFLPFWPLLHRKSCLCFT